MLTFIMLTRLSPQAVRSPQALEDLERQAMERVRKECPDVEWIKKLHDTWVLAIIWTYSALKTSRQRARSRRWYAPFGHAHTEIWTATKWDRFKEIVRTL